MVAQPRRAGRHPRADPHRRRVEATRATTSSTSTRRSRGSSRAWRCVGGHLVPARHLGSLHRARVSLPARRWPGGSRTWPSWRPEKPRGPVDRSPGGDQPDRRERRPRHHLVPPWSASTTCPASASTPAGMCPKGSRTPKNSPAFRTELSALDDDAPPVPDDRRVHLQQAPSQTSWRPSRGWSGRSAHLAIAGRDRPGPTSPPASSSSASGPDRPRPLPRVPRRCPRADPGVERRAPRLRARGVAPEHPGVDVPRQAGDRHAHPRHHRVAGPRRRGDPRRGGDVEAIRAGLGLDAGSSRGGARLRDGRPPERWGLRPAPRRRAARRHLRARPRGRAARAVAERASRSRATTSMVWAGAPSAQSRRHRRRAG